VEAEATWNIVCGACAGAVSALGRIHEVLTHGRDEASWSKKSSQRKQSALKCE
jgi:hypothetical protein